MTGYNETFYHFAFPLTSHKGSTVVAPEGDEVKKLTQTYLHTPLQEEQVAINNHQADSH